MPDLSNSHQWDDLSPQEVLHKLVYELYSPVSALGSEVDRLASGTFEDDELLMLIGQMRAGVNHLSAVVVALKQYTKAQQEELNMIASEAQVETAAE